MPRARKFQAKAGLRRFVTMSVGGLALLLTSVGYSGVYPIAGLHPDQRPAGAPKITRFEKNKAWYQRALHGVQPPYPASLRFLEDEGAWYTPFIHPGMTGRYDIRRWHR